MMNCSLSLSGIDFIPSDKNYQFWLLLIQNWDTGTCKSLFAIAMIENKLYLEIFFVRLLGEL